MIELAGALAVSDFRIAKLRPALEAIHPGIGAVSARFIHFVDLDRDLDARERALLDRLLTYGPREDGAPQRRRAAKSSSCRASARSRPGRARPPTSRTCAASTPCAASSAASSGTRSPATAHRASSCSALAAPLFDRMTETALFERADAAQLFVTGEDAPAAHGVAGERPRCARARRTRELGLALSDDEIDYLVDELRRA